MLLYTVFGMCKNMSVNIQKNGISASDHDRETSINKSNKIE